MKNVVIAGYYGFKNLGDELILSKIIEDIGSEWNVTVVSGDPEYTQKLHKVKAITRFSVDDVVEAVRNSDIVVVGGGGLIQEYFGIHIEDLFKSFGYGTASYSLVPWLGKMLGKPVFFWSHGVGPIFSQEGRDFARWFYSLADFATVRDDDSYGLLKWLCPQLEDVHADTDPVMGLDLRKFIGPTPPGLDSDKIKIGINIRPWFATEDIIRKVAGALNELFPEGRDLLVVPVPFDLAHDKEPLRRLIDLLPQERVADCGFEEMETPEEVIPLMSGLDFFMGMRLHPLIVSRLLEIPSFSISYDLKTDKFADILGTPAIRVEELTRGSLIAGMRSLLGRERKDLGELTFSYDTPRLFKEFVESKLHHLQGKPLQKDPLYYDYVTSDLIKGHERFVKSLQAEVQEKEQQISSLTAEKGSFAEQFNQVALERDSLLAEKGSFAEELDQVALERDSLLAEKGSLGIQVSQLTAERDNFFRELSNIYTSRFWKVASFYRRIRYEYFKYPGKFLSTLRREGIRIAVQKAYRKLKRRSPHQTQPEAAHQKSSIREFLSRNGANDIYIVYAGVRFTDSEGQRSVRLSQSLLDLNKTVIYVYWNWSKEDKDVYGEISDGLFALAKDDFLYQQKELMTLISNAGRSIVLLIEFPDPNIIPVLLEGNSLNFKTIYDLLDDWEEFHKAGQAVWYDRGSELFILRNTRHRFAITTSLIQKFRLYDVHLLPNGFDAKKLKDRRAIDIPRADTTIGYFGHLTDAWFDWDLVIETAKSNSSFMFHLIGYGKPNGLELPDNIKCFGKVHPNELSSYVKNWDVCIIPFKNSKLSRSVDPIKLYEYLYFQKPVVLTGLSHLDAFPYVIHSQNDQELFRQAILTAKEIPVENGVVIKFLEDKSWLARAKSMVEILKD